MRCCLTHDHLVSWHAFCAQSFVGRIGSEELWEGMMVRHLVYWEMFCGRQIGCGMIAGGLRYQSGGKQWRIDKSCDIFGRLCRFWGAGRSPHDVCGDGNEMLYFQIPRMRKVIEILVWLRLLVQCYSDFKARFGGIPSVEYLDSTAHVYSCMI